MSQFAARAGQKGAKVAKLAMFTATDVEISLMLFFPLRRHRFHCLLLLRNKL